MSELQPKPVVLFDPFPRTRDMLFTDIQWQRLNDAVTIVSDDAERMPDAIIKRHISEVELVIGQTELSSERLARAGKLRAVINVEGNFLPNIDYPSCFARGIHVLAIAPGFARPVAEHGLALALNLARGIPEADRAFRDGCEQYGLAGNKKAFLLTGSSIGLVGFGNLGRALLPLLKPFRAEIRVFDPWLPESYLRDLGMLPATLDEVLSASKTIFVLAGLTDDNQAMIGRQEFARIADDASFVLLSRAGVVDWNAFQDETRSSRIRGATDVFPTEPVDADDPVRGNANILLSAHRAGGLYEVFHRIGEMVVDDTLLILQGLPPVFLQAARRETVERLRSPPGRSYQKGEI